MHACMCPYIQSEVDERTRRRLEKAAHRHNTSIKAVIREAVHEYLDHDEPLDDDPIWDFIGGGDLPPGDWSTKKNWRFPELD